MPPSKPEIVLPQYIQPIPLRIMREDLDYLKTKGAFLIPEAAFRNELLRCYVQYVHPYLPIIDLGDFLSAIEKDEPSDSISLLLFQAVMFAGTAYIDMRYLVAQGYVTRKAARKAFFQKVKLLYDFDYEIDRVTVVQGVLLMTYWYENPDDPKDVWHWLGVAISVARTIGLNCDTSDAPLMNHKQRCLWKRIWWSCFMRDRLIAIGMRRPMRINDGDFDVSTLEISDFETDALPQEVIRMLGGCPSVRDTSKRVTLAKMCISLTKLCICITQVLAVQYSTLGHKIGATQETTMRLVPKKCAAEPSEVIRCDAQLGQWHEDLPANLHYFGPDFRVQKPSNDGEVINLHRALLSGVYLTAISALHRPQILPSTPNVVIAPELREMSRRKVREAANNITEMYKELHAHDLIRYLPNTGVTCLLPAIIIHLLDIKSTDSETRQSSIRKFQFCMQALQRLREMYASADFAFSFLDAAVRKTNAEASTDMSMTGAAIVRPQLTTEPPKMAKKKISRKPLLLTPPPEAMQTANLLLLNSTLAPGEKNLLAEYTPPGSNASMNSYTTAGAAVALLDVGDALEDGDSNQFDDLCQTNFEDLINVEGGPELFPTNDDGFDMHIQWLEDFNADGFGMDNKEFSLDGTGNEEDLSSMGPGYVDQALNITGDHGLDLEVHGGM
ncbi:hypothetical protein LTR84_012768 [Exophiala bonariae]|uniref:Xylanolytic transcriptional activator regulatory domain-containing protein n=1 Tax=Exophiala bonariae TaxID=1690606 RepID=A0AAV9NEX2_9EURO|nr:hypothetical protein LTR84_012768 [Exophiala bonariae]